MTKKTYFKVKESDVMAMIYLKRGLGAFSHKELTEWVCEMYPEKPRINIYRNVMTLLDRLPVKSLGQKIYCLDVIAEASTKELKTPKPEKIKKVNSGEESLTHVAKDVIAYFNLVTNSAIKPVTSNVAKIVARLKDGFTYQDCQVVIDKKYKEWRGSPMEKYVRIETLFNGKFVSYLNQKDTFNNQVEKMASYSFEKYTKGDL